MSVAEILAEMEQVDPAAVPLAEAASLAAEIEPALLRRLRRALVPEATPLAEAVVWSSALAVTRTPASLLFHDDVLADLRARLAADQDRLDEARAVVEEAHRGVAEILRCEEDLVYYGLVDLERKPRPGLDRAGLHEILRARLDQVAATILADASRRDGLVAWCARALPTLPDGVRTHGSGAALGALAAHHGLVSGSAYGALFPPSDRDVPLGARWTDKGLVLTAPEDGAPVLRLPPVNPCLLEIEAEAAGVWGAPARYAISAPGQITVPLPEKTALIRVRSLRGDGVMLEAKASSTEPIWVLVAGNGTYSIPEVELLAAEALGVYLAESGYHLVTCAYPGVDHVAARAFHERAAAADGPEAANARLLRIVREGRAPDFEWGTLEYVPSDDDEYWESAARSAGVIVIGDTAGTQKVIATALRLGRPIVAYPGTGNGPDTARATVRMLVSQLAEPAPLTIWAGPEILILATRYMRPDPTALVQRSAEALTRQIQARLYSSSDGDRPPPALENITPPERVIAHLIAELSPSPSPALDALLDAADSEASLMERIGSARVLYRALVAVRAAFSERPPPPDVGPRLSRIRNALAHGTRKLDDSDACIKLLEQLIDAATGDTGFETFAARYERLRASMEGGTGRTSAFEALTEEIRATAARTRPNADDIRRLFTVGRAGHRVAALAASAGAPESAPLDVIKEALERPYTPFEQWAAVWGAKYIITDGPAELAQGVASLLRTVLAEPENLINAPKDATRRVLARTSLRALERRFPPETSEKKPAAKKPATKKGIKK